jgi:membrane-associated protein
MQLLDFFNHIPVYLQYWAINYGAGIYLILFLIVFCETGLVVTPLLPGDSLLFATGAMLATSLPGLDLGTMWLVISAAAILGDISNFSFGRFMAPRLFKTYEARWLNRKHLDRTQAFYQKHGGKTIILARFMPIVRTYAPFVAGLSGMAYRKYAMYSIAGGVAWVVSFISLGYFFGNLPTVKSNFQYVVIGIIAVSLVPMILEYWKSRRAKLPAR